MAPNPVARLLGESGVLPEIVSDEDWDAALRSGLPVAALDAVTAEFGFTPGEIERCVVPRKTAARRRSRGERLKPDESERLARLARVALRAKETLGTAAEAVEWLRRRNRALQSHSPLEMLATPEGARMVEVVLARSGSGLVS
ncbi:MAG TPA: antitoxin Xre-like helix-turn-helix domain-containing protein [Longimicrobium sp.]|jgi:putative toxin-antitoxin system antitoxin component (TIGR02293 family)